MQLSETNSKSLLQVFSDYKDFQVYLKIAEQNYLR